MCVFSRFHVPLSGGDKENTDAQLFVFALAGGGAFTASAGTFSPRNLRIVGELGSTTNSED